MSSETHKHTVTPGAEPGLRNWAEPSPPLRHSACPRPVSSARLGSAPFSSLIRSHNATCSTGAAVYREQQRAERSRSQAPVTRLSPGAANWITAPGSNPSSALSASRDQFPFHGEKINTHRCSAEGHQGGGGGGRTVPSRAGPDCSYLRATAASHCSQGGRARSLAQLHGASAQQQRGLEPDRRGEETDSPARSACMHSLRSGAIPEAEPGAETVPTVRLSGPAR